MYNLIIQWKQWYKTGFSGDLMNACCVYVGTYSLMFERGKRRENRRECDWMNECVCERERPTKDKWPGGFGTGYGAHSNDH